ncbi:hypothetical protein L596_003565 [Steinernema carpocapsae]|uniref:ZP domain-containing protein n=1 Tax=Steinernema carpocapsae TaxID=34508 RepID=A0A4U8USV9_STECR|nr:hypothetical protein L596_003565 [Steinernema carpocapsae]
MFLKFLLWTVLISAGLAVDCDNAKLHLCYPSMQKTLNLTVGQPWSYPEKFREEIEKLYGAEAKVGLRKICQAFRAFLDCYGNTYRQCMVPMKIVGSGVTPKAAYEFVSVFSQFHYTCGAGVNVFVNAEVCMTKVWSSNKGELDNARVRFNSKVDVVPDSACDLAQTLLLKQYQIKFNECTIGGKFWACEYARIYVFNRFPQCSLTCSSKIQKTSS